MLGCLLFYIGHFSPGYAWHGFPFGLFIVTEVPFLLAEDTSGKAEGVLRFATLIQAVICFACYIPLQTVWFEGTREAIRGYREEICEIRDDVSECLQIIGGEQFSIDQSLKRYRPVPVTEITRNAVRRAMPYPVFYGYTFLDLLESADRFWWKSLREMENYSESENQYVIWILPNCFMNMGDIVPFHYDINAAISEWHGESYSIYLIEVGG